jgi:hypothetical protein
VHQIGQLLGLYWDALSAKHQNHSSVMREWWFIPLRLRVLMYMWGYQDTDMSGDFFNSSFEVGMKSALHSGKDQPSVTVFHALLVKESYGSIKLQHTVLNNVIVLVGILRWQLFYRPRSLFVWNISAVLVYWRQSSVLWPNGLIIKPIPGLKNIAGHPLVDKW